MLADQLNEALERPPWDEILTETPYGIVDPVYYGRGRRREPKYTGLLGPRHQAAMDKGYVDLGLIDPRIALETKTKERFMHIVAGPLAGVFMNPKVTKGVAFLRDPEGLIVKTGVDLKKLADAVKVEIASHYEEQSTYDSEAEDWDSQSAHLSIADAVEKARITVTKVEGKTGQGYKFVMKPTLEEIEKAHP